MAYKGNSKLVVSSSFLYNTLQTFYTKIKGLLDNKADKTALNSINPNTISGGYTKNSFYVNTHPENSGAIIPFVNNDIAFLLKRGGSAKIYYDDAEASVDISNVFDGSPSYWAIDPTNVKKVVIELTLHKTFTWTNTVYVDFGSAGWRAKSVAIDVINTNNKETEWTNKSTITNNSIGEHKITFSHNNGTGFNKVRFTFSDWATASIFRISCLGLVNYGSSGLRETFLPKDGGSVYGAITPYSNNSIDLGSSSSKWKNVYATTFNGNLSGNADTATKLKAAKTIQTNLSSTSSASFDGSSNVAPGITGVLPVTNGGTGQDSISKAANAFINSLSTGGSVPTDNDYFISQYVDGGETSTTYHRRPIRLLWEYIKNKTDKLYSLSSHTHNYIPLSGSTSITGALRTNSELQSTSANGLRLVQGDYGMILRNDGGSTYVLFTKQGDPYGGWNDLRPLIINNANGAVICNNGITGNLTGNASSSSRMIFSSASRPTNANIALNNSTTNGVQLDLATTSMTANKPAKDGFITTYSWDTTAGYGSQFFIENNSSPTVQVRGCNAGTWDTSWKTLIDSGNYKNYCAPKYTYGTSALTPGSSSLANGTLYFQYE